MLVCDSHSALLLAVDGGLPFATQFFHDDYDDGPGFDDVYDGGDGGAPVEAGEQDLLAATQGHTRRVKPEAVNYAKRAKRVDVRKLKENIWKGLDIVSPAVEDNDDPMVSGVRRIQTRTYVDLQPGHGRTTTDRSR